MLPASLSEIERRLAPADIVLDVGGWAAPIERADWVIDLMPYETRGLYGKSDPERERFSRETWIQRDMCDREPFPFADDSVDFVICSHTLEDIRDPVWVCHEMQRIARAGYIEVPSRLEEQSFGVHGDWVGWSHHRWLVEIGEGRIEFAFKPGVLHGRREFQIPAGFAAALPVEDRVQTLFWEGGFEVRERIFMSAEEADGYLAELVRSHPEARLRGRRRRLSRTR